MHVLFKMNLIIFGYRLAKLDNPLSPPPPNLPIVFLYSFKFSFDGIWEWQAWFLSSLNYNWMFGTGLWETNLRFRYSWFHIKGTWSVHSFNGDYLSIPEGTGSCGYLFHEILGINTYILKKSLTENFLTHYVVFIYKYIFMLQMKRKLIHWFPVYSLTHSSVRIQLLYPIWSLCPGAGLVLYTN